MVEDGAERWGGSYRQRVDQLREWGKILFGLTQIRMRGWVGVDVGKNFRPGYFGGAIPFFTNDSGVGMG